MLNLVLFVRPLIVFKFFPQSQKNMLRIKFRTDENRTTLLDFFYKDIQVTSQCVDPSTLIKHLFRRTTFIKR